MGRPRQPHFAEVPREAGPVECSTVLPELTPGMRREALAALRRNGYRPVTDHLWRVRVLGPGGFEIDRAAHR